MLYFFIVVAMIFTVIFIMNSKNFYYNLYNITFPYFKTLNIFWNSLLKTLNVIKNSENFSTVNWHLYNEKRKQYSNYFFKKL